MDTIVNLINVMSKPGIYQTLRDENEFVVNVDNDLMFHYKNDTAARPNICLLRDVLFKKVDKGEYSLIFSQKEN